MASTATLEATWWSRIEQQTPPTRDRAIDALRAIGILGVVLGHWLVTALVSVGHGTIVDHTPLASMPGLDPISWLFQTLAVFFLVGGYSADRSLSHTPYRIWIRQRLARLSRPVPALLLAWLPLMAILWGAGLAPKTLLLVGKLVVSPLWFLLVFAALTAFTPVAVRLWERLGSLAIAGVTGFVAAIDLLRFALHGPGWLGWFNLGFGWLVPYLLGIAWSRGAFSERRTTLGLAATGLGTALALVLFAGYSGAMVGVPGHGVSSLNPPTLATVAFGVGQVGLALTLRGPLARLMQRPRVWAATALANLSAMTIFLWHQSAMLLTTLTLLCFGALPGLHDEPSGFGWIAARLLWLPVFAAVLTCLWMIFRGYERSR